MPRKPRRPPNPLDDELVEAAGHNDVDRVRELVARGADPNAQVSDYGPVICVAAARRQWDLVAALAAGADVNARDREYGYTPLHWAVLHGDLHAVRELMGAGADPRVKDRWGNTPLFAVCDGFGFDRDHRLDPDFCRQVAEMLLRAGCDPDEPNSGGNTARKIALDPQLGSPVPDLFRDLPVRPALAPASAEIAVPVGPPPAADAGPPAVRPPSKSPVVQDPPGRMQGLVRAGVATRAEMLKILLDEQGAESDADVARVTGELDLEIARKTADERTWPTVLDTDRLDRAFAALEQRGVLCLHDAGYTQSDGFGDAEERREEEGGDESPFDAYCFYHRQDVESAVAGRGLYIAFGSFASREGERKVGRKIANALEEAGLRVDWDDDPSKPLHVPQFDFRRRGMRTD